MVATGLMERKENISESVSLPERETGSQGKSELCVTTQHNTTLPDNIVTGVTIQLQLILSSLRQCDQKVSSYIILWDSYSYNLVAIAPLYL